MHGRLKQVALKFDEGEQSRQAKLRKARKEMEVELTRLTNMNEELFQSCQQFQEKHLEQIEVNLEQKHAYQVLVEERERQGQHITQLVSINKGQMALLENLKQRLNHHMAMRHDFGIMTGSNLLRRSRSSSV